MCINSTWQRRTYLRDPIRRYATCQSVQMARQVGHLIRQVGVLERRLIPFRREYPTSGRRSQADALLDNEYITGTHKGECLHETQALSFRTAHGVGEYLLATGAHERIFLQIKILVKG